MIILVLNNGTSQLMEHNIIQQKLPFLKVANSIKMQETIVVYGVLVILTENL